MTALKEKPEHSVQTCMGVLMPVRDALQVIEGKWKLPIIISLRFGTKRFKEISREVNGITDKMLSKELKSLEEHQLIKRTVYDAFPPAVEYSITEYGQSLQKVIDALAHWGIKHRKKIMGK